MALSHLIPTTYKIYCRFKSSHFIAVHNSYVSGDGYKVFGIVKHKRYKQETAHYPNEINI